jgi:hypothetical protein
LFISSARTDNEFGQQHITSGVANEEIEMIKIQNDNNVKNI